MDWITTEIKNNIKDLIKCKKNYAKFAYTEQKKYKDVFNTFDKYEAKDHEYWRSQELANLRFICLKGTLRPSDKYSLIVRIFSPL